MKKIVINFLDKYYTLSINHDKIIFVAISTKAEYNYVEFLNMIRKIFGEDVTSQGSVFDFFAQWFEDKKSKLLTRLYNYLGECSMHLAARDWVVYHNYSSTKTNKEVNAEDLVALFGHEYTVKFIQYYYEQWYEEQVFNISEKIMSKF